ncbi:F-box protein At3g07870 [Prunus persica]|uniref:F-box protein At3g07870 n=1 Tax=Prunus persica TaxID=3760 RepID=UPI0009ABA534|nr:F-box protein At3g07870 [Prunus persica]
MDLVLASRRISTRCCNPFIRWSTQSVAQSTTLRLRYTVYTIGTGVWRSIGNAPSDLLKFPFSALFHEALHWVSLAVESAECIHSFSFETEQFRSLPLTSNYGRVKREFHDLLKLGVLGGCLVLCVFGGCASRELDMWVMKDYGVQESWNKILVIEDLYMKDVSCHYTEPVMILIDGQILMAFNGRDVVFDNQEVKSLGKSQITPTGSAFDATSYSACFVPLSKVFKEEEVKRVRGSNIQDGKKSDKLLAEGSYRYELKLIPTIETACTMCGEQLGYVSEA